MKHLESKPASSLPAFAFFDLGIGNTWTPSALPSKTKTQEVCPPASHEGGFTFTGVGVKHASAWSYCGPLLHARCLAGMPSTFQQWQDESIDGDLLALLLPFLKHADEFLHLNGLQHYWITVRATKPDDEFEKPRWHTDDLFYERYLNGSDGERSLRGPVRHLWPMAPNANPPSTPHAQPTDWKLIATLSGPSTLFIAPAHQQRARRLQRNAKIKCGKEHVCDSIRCVGCSTAASHVRETLGSQLRCTPVVRPGVGRPVFLRVGHQRGAVHSEPDLGGGDRVFVNVVPGTEGELMGLMAKWGMGFPREWAVMEGVISGVV